LQQPELAFEEGFLHAEPLGGAQGFPGFSGFADFVVTHRERKMGFQQFLWEKRILLACHGAGRDWDPGRAARPLGKVREAIAQVGGQIRLFKKTLYPKAFNDSARPPFMADGF
jgi:hypothetical protein